MAKHSVRLFFSREHTGRQSGEREVDSYRQRSDRSKPEKTGHNPTPTTKIQVRRGK